MARSIDPGTTGQHTAQVDEADTAPALGSGDVPVLATPRLIAWLEAAAVAAIYGILDESETSVGTLISVEHTAASPVGALIECHATVIEVVGRMVTFEVNAEVHGPEAVKSIASGTHTRAIVDRARFIAATLA